jgi:hypothetical protein
VLTDVHVIVDAVGYLLDIPGYQSLNPTRYADSRDSGTFDGQFRNTGRGTAGTVWTIPIGGRGVVPSTACSVVANVTITGPSAPGFATVYDCGTRPGTSSLNYGPGITRPNEVIAQLSPDGDLCVFTLSDTHVIVDIVGHTRPRGRQREKHLWHVQRDLTRLEIGGVDPDIRLLRQPSPLGFEHGEIIQPPLKCLPFGRRCLPDTEWSVQPNDARHARTVSTTPVATDRRTRPPQLGLWAPR